MSTPFSTRPSWRAISLATLMSALVPLSAAESSEPIAPTPSPIAPTRTSTQSTNSLPLSDFRTFKIVSDRNIFNPNRSPRGSRTEGESRKPPKVETLSLVGVLEYEKGTFAFFDGSSRDFKKTLQSGGHIAGMQIAEITSQEVRLTAGEVSLRLVVGGHLKRTDEEPWQNTNVPEPASSETKPEKTAPDSSDSTPDSSSILERLRKKREKEMNK